MGDVGLDGLADVAVGAPSEADVGYVHLNYGPISGNVDLLASDANFTGNPGSFAGIDLVIHDFNADGRGDLAITAYYEGAVDLFWNGS